MDKGNILESWKAIGAHLNRNVRTCQLWEREHGLPIHRLDGSPKARVFAYTTEIDRWFEGKVRERDRASNGRPAKKGRAVLPTLPRWNIGLIAGLVTVAIAAVGTTVWLLVRQAKVRWANDVAIPEIERLVETSDAKTPYELLLKVERIAPGAHELAILRSRVISTVSFQTDPPGAAVWIKDYGAADTAWQFLGRSPIEKRRLCQGYKEWKTDLPGYEPAERAFQARAGYEMEVEAVLDRSDEVPPGMVRISGGHFEVQTPNLVHLPSVDLQDFFIDRYEVTNKEYQRFVDAGGYGDIRYWKIEFFKDGRPLSWAAAMRELVDATGQPGPAVWREGRYPEGQADYPVSGVSWYEAAAYAEFAGKRLPSLYHWEYAAGNYHEDSGHFVPASNFDGQGPAPAGRYKGLSPFGAYDMAGNVKEWCWNEVGGKRLSRGGAWNEPDYLFVEPDNYPPSMRAANFGFRCIKEIPGREAPTEAFGSFKTMALPDFSRPAPCSDEVFEAYRRLYDYTRSDLAPKVESVLDWSDDTTVEKVSYTDASGEERIPAYLFLPRLGRPPFRTIVYFPGDSAFTQSSIYQYGPVKNREIEMFTRKGLAFVFPVYRGMFERKDAQKPYQTWTRGFHLRNFRDLSRCLDYLETRVDIDRDRLAYQGLSGGGGIGILFAALEKRLKAAVLMSGGLYASSYIPADYAPEEDYINFAPRVRIPVLMQNGRYDFLLPPEKAVKPLFALLGTPAEDKKLIIYESGHSIWLLGQYRRDIFDFLDRYLGPSTVVPRSRRQGNSANGRRDPSPSLLDPATNPKRPGRGQGRGPTSSDDRRARRGVYGCGGDPRGRIPRVKSRHPSFEPLKGLALISPVPGPPGPTLGEARQAVRGQNPFPPVLASHRKGGTIGQDGNSCASRLRPLDCRPARTHGKRR